MDGGMSQSAQAWLRFAIAAVAIALFFLLLRGSGGGGHDPPEVAKGGQGSAIAESHRDPASTRAETPAPQPAALPDSDPAESPSLEGNWSAVGEVQWVDSGVNSNQPPGTILNRPWNFQEICAESCRIAFTRGTLYGPSVTWLVQDGRGYTADFPPVQVPCAYPRGSSYARHPFGYSHDWYRLWWSPDHTKLLAVEHRTQTGCYSTPERPDTTRWQAVRAG
jgi:hypothetical protein